MNICHPPLPGLPGPRLGRLWEMEWLVMERKRYNCGHYCFAPSILVLCHLSSSFPPPPTTNLEPPPPSRPHRLPRPVPAPISTCPTPRRQVGSPLTPFQTLLAPPSSPLTHLLNSTRTRWRPTSPPPTTLGSPSAAPRVLSTLRSAVLRAQPIRMRWISTAVSDALVVVATGVPVLVPLALLIR